LQDFELTNLTYFWCFYVGEELDEKLLNFLFLFVADSRFFRVIVLSGIGLCRTRACNFSGCRTDARIAESARAAATATSAASEIDVFWKKRRKMKSWELN
jgi:hypothetical protein